MECWCLVRRPHRPSFLVPTTCLTLELTDQYRCRWGQQRLGRPRPGHPAGKRKAEVVTAARRRRPDHICPTSAGSRATGTAPKWKAKGSRYFVIELARTRVVSSVRSLDGRASPDSSRGFFRDVGTRTKDE
eukprot:scaffold186571_cov28-Tisochrysis_lutea.AAC.6